MSNTDPVASSFNSSPSCSDVDDYPIPGDDDLAGRTRRGQQTIMPERAEHIVESIESLTTAAGASRGNLKVLWANLRRDFWAFAKRRHAADPAEHLNRNVRDLAAIVTRKFTAGTLELILAAVYAELSGRERASKMLPQQFEIVRKAATTPVRSRPGAGPDADVSRWITYL